MDNLFSDGTWAARLWLQVPKRMMPSMWFVFKAAYSYPKDLLKIGGNGGPVQMMPHNNNSSQVFVF